MNETLTQEQVDKPKQSINQAEAKPANTETRAQFLTRMALILLGYPANPDAGQDALKLLAAGAENVRDESPVAKKLKDQALADIPLTESSRQQLTESLAKMDNPEGWQGVFELNPIGDISSLQARVVISPSAAEMRKALESNKVGENTKETYRQYLAQGADQIIDLQLTNGGGNITYGLSTLYLTTDVDGHRIAYGPNYVGRLGRSMREDEAIREGDANTSRRLRRNEDITLGPSEIYADALVVNKHYRGQGFGTPLVHLGNLLAQSLGADKRVFWTDATNKKEGKSYYERHFGATPKSAQITMQDIPRTVPVISLR